MGVSQSVLASQIRSFKDELIADSSSGYSSSSGPNCGLLGVESSMSDPILRLFVANLPLLLAALHVPSVDSNRILHDSRSFCRMAKSNSSWEAKFATQSGRFRGVDSSESIWCFFGPRWFTSIPRESSIS